MRKLASKSVWVVAVLSAAACASSSDGAGGSSGNAGANGGSYQPGFGGNNNNNGNNGSAGTGTGPKAGSGVNNGGSGVNNGGGSTGTAGSGVGNAGSGGGSTGSAGAGGSTAVMGGAYLKSGTWKGYAWTAAGGMATISPKDFSTVTDFPLCAKGNLMGGYDNVAMVGWNINQDAPSKDVLAPAAMSVTPMKKGINVKLKNQGGSTLRLQIQGANGGTDPNDRWCAVIPGTGGFVPYDAFNTECWAGGMGKPYANQPIVAAIVLVPGSTTPTAFDFCVDQLIEADSDAPVANAGCDLTGGPGEGGGNITGDDTRSVTRASRNYIVQNNVWNGSKTAQTLAVNGVSFEVTAQGNNQGTSGAPTGYPSVFIGSNFGRTSSGSGLPKQVSALQKVPTGWRWSGNPGGQWNAAYDVWFSKNAGGDSGSPSAGYLMVWLHDPSGAQPLGSPAGTETVAGKTWQVWTCPGGCQNGVPVISYVPANNASLGELTFDLLDFIKNAQQKYPQNMSASWYLSNVFAGFEIWSGGQGLKTADFCAQVQ